MKCWIYKGNIINLVTDLAARSFSLTPPIGSTRPLNVSSPVIAVSALTHLHVWREIKGM